MKYLYLSILLFFVVVGFEYFTKELVGVGVPTETMAILNTTVYIASGIFMIAFVSSLKKLKLETKQILYLVVLAVIALKALQFLRAA